MLHYSVHDMHFENRWKCLAERLLVLQTCVSHHTLRTRLSVAKTSISLSLSLSTIISKVHNCIPMSALFTQIQPPSCLRCDNARPKGNLGSSSTKQLVLNGAE